MVNVEFGHDHVIVEHTIIDRPSAISPSQWLEFWESKTPAGVYDAAYDHGYEDGFNEGKYGSTQRGNNGSR